MTLALQDPFHVEHLYIIHCMMAYGSYSVIEVTMKVACFAQSSHSVDSSQDAMGQFAGLGSFARSSKGV